MTTDTDTLIARLSQQPRQSWAQFRRWQSLAFVAALVLSLILQGTLLGVRSDLAAQLSQPDFLFKLIFLSLVAVYALRALAISLIPGGAPFASPHVLYALLGGVVLLAIVPILRGDLPRIGSDALQCLLWINVFGLVPLAVLGWFMRRAAPTNRLQASTALALAAWSCSALAYTIHCDSDLAFAAASGNLTMLVMYALAFPGMAALAYLTRNVFIKV